MNEHGIAFFIGPRLDRDRARGDGCIALGHHNEAQIALVDLHQGLSGLDLLTHVDETLHDFSGHAKAEIALHPGGDGAGEAAVGFGGRCGHGQPDERSVLPRVADGGRFLRTKEECTECRRPERREQDAPHHKHGLPFHGASTQNRLRSTSIWTI